jgi:hypothetical protein
VSIRLVTRRSQGGPIVAESARLDPFLDSDACALGIFGQGVTNIGRCRAVISLQDSKSWKITSNVFSRTDYQLTSTNFDFYTASKLIEAAPSAERFVGEVCDEQNTHQAIPHCIETHLAL